MSDHTTDTYRTLKNVVQDLINSIKINVPYKTSSVKTNPLPKYRDVSHTKNKPPPNHSITPQLKIISSGSCESQAKGNHGSCESQSHHNYLINPTYHMES